MLVVRGTQKLRDRVKGASAADGDASTTALGDWFATALFWRPQVALLVNARTLLPVFTELAPAARLLDRAPGAIDAVLRRHGVAEGFLAAERAAMREVRIGPTNDRSVVGVMNEFAFLGEFHWRDGLRDLEELSLRMARVPLGPLRKSTGFPDSELASVVGNTVSSATVIAFPGTPTPPEPATRTRAPRRAVYQLKVTLLDTKPPIWRRVLVDARSTLDQLHEVIQAAFGWWNYHLHEFEVDGSCYGVPNPDWDWNPPRDERRVRLDSIAAEGTSFRYTYDLGDNWEHRVLVEKVTPATADTVPPACIDGRRACPPEDCGGTGGYRDLLEILADPSHPEHDERHEWIGSPFDPDVFDPAEFEDNLRDQRLATFDDDD